MSNLVLKQITDKNGKQTHVRVRADQNAVSKRLVRVSAPAVASHRPTAVNVPEPSSEALAGRIMDYPDVIKPWDGIPLEHTQFKYAGMKWDLAPKGYSGGYCDRCASFFTTSEIEDADEHNSLLSCRVCRKIHTTGQLQSAVRYEDRKFFDKEVTRETEWYHVSTKPNWEEAITEMESSEQPLIHAGSLDAAESRMNYIKTLDDDYSRMKGVTDTANNHVTWGPDAKFYRYTLRITDDAKIANTLLPDADDDAPLTSSGSAYGKYKDRYARTGVTRYVNEYESHGSVSVMMHPSAFDVVERVEL